MSKRQSREEWEQELREIQHNVTPEQQLRTSHLLAKKAARNSDGGLIKDIAHLLRFFSAVVMLSLGVIGIISGDSRFVLPGIVVFVVGAFIGFNAISKSNCRRRLLHNERGAVVGPFKSS